MQHHQFSLGTFLTCHSIFKGLEHMDAVDLAALVIELWQLNGSQEDFQTRPKCDNLKFDNFLTAGSLEVGKITLTCADAAICGGLI